MGNDAESNSSTTSILSIFTPPTRVQLKGNDVFRLLGLCSAFMTGFVIAIQSYSYFDSDSFDKLDLIGKVGIPMWFLSAA